MVRGDSVVVMVRSPDRVARSFISSVRALAFGRLLDAVEVFGPKSLVLVDPLGRRLERLGHKALSRCSRPCRVRFNSPADSRTRMCFETAASEMPNGAAMAVTVSSPEASRARTARRVGSARAKKTRFSGLE